MAKQTAPDPIEVLKKIHALTAPFADTDADSSEAEDEAPEKPTLPTAKEIKALDDEEVIELAKSLGLKAKKPAVAKAQLTLAASVIADKEVDEEELTALVEALGLEDAGDAEANADAVKEYFSGTEAEATEDDESPSEDDDEASAKPAKKPGKVAAASDDDDEDSGELSDDQKLALYNKTAGKKKPLKKYAQLEELLTDKDGEVAEWGKAYVRLEDPDDEASEEMGFCCGAPLKEVPDHDGYGQCAVTGKFFKQNPKTGNLVETADPNE